jgi:1,4-alpha-glucan branching enzyme
MTSPFLTDFDLHLLREGTHYRTYLKLGAHLAQCDGVRGTHFAVWAPNARAVSVIGDFNGWRRDANPMTLRPAAGVWECFIPGVTQGGLYKYAITSRYHNYQVDKADPYGFAAEIRPATASKVWDLSGYSWADQEWMSQRARRQSLEAPIAIYEVHLGSWMRVPEEGHRWLSYREVAPKLAEYAQRMGYTHVEFLPLCEHPLDGSWGYQTVGYFAPTSRFGTPQDLMYLVDVLHQHGIGVIMDWVPAHFPRDAHGLGYFDGTHLYEHADPRQGEHKEWGTFVFNYGRPEVSNFLISNALFWFDTYHLDGLRVDAVASMLYLDYARNEGEWIPNRYGGRENLEAVDFVRRFNEQVYAEYPDILTIAEESTAWGMVSRPTYVGGLGFGLKWDMGWMHDTLSYFSHDPVHRKYHHGELTFRMIYAFNENFVMPLSHDEVVHGKGSLLGKMPGDDWQKFANVRLLLGYMTMLPGKKLLFMGDDIGQWREWNHDESVHWHLLQHASHQGVQRWVRDLNMAYRQEAALHQLDCEPGGFEWIDCNDADTSVVTFLRRAKSSNDMLLIACNFTPVPRQGYLIGVPRGGYWKEILNSDAAIYGGTDVGNAGGLEASPVPTHGRSHSLKATLPPLAVVVFRAPPKESERALPPAGGGRPFAPAPDVTWQPALGAWPEPGGTHFRVWAPAAKGVDVVLEDGASAPATHALTKGEEGCFGGVVEDAVAGQLYRYLIDGRGPYPDPASRFQPDGVHGPSEIIDPGQFPWSDRNWRGVPPEALIFYELHVGTFSPEGTFAGVMERLPVLRDLGITALELMPVADFAGDRNWGYDGVALFAPARCYGRPDDLRRLVDRAHELGLAVYLDVVYNHLGPDGAYLSRFSPYYFSPRHQTPWGKAVNLDGEHSDMVRRFFIENALHWVREYHIDGLRLDATHALIDDSPRHFLAELSAHVHGAAGRDVLVIAEDNRNLSHAIKPQADGGWGLDGVWADDFHHQMRRCLAGDCEGYFRDFTASISDLATIARRGWLYCGQYSEHFQGPRGTDPTGIPLHKFIICLQNHDQVGNRATGDRLHHHIRPATYRAAAALLLCVPETPLLFMGQEWAATTPFLYFSDHNRELGKRITAGRRNEFRHFSAFSDPEARQHIPDPQALSTFMASRLDWSEPDREAHRSVLQLYRALLHLRRTEPALQSADGAPFEVAACEDALVLLRRPVAGTKARVLLAVIQLRGAGVVDLQSTDIAPQLRQLGVRAWEVVLSTEEPRFCPDPVPILADTSEPAPSVAFRRPGALILRPVPEESATASGSASGAN